MPQIKVVSMPPAKVTAPLLTPEVRVRGGFLLSEPLSNIQIPSCLMAVPGPPKRQIIRDGRNDIARRRRPCQRLSRPWA